MISNKIRLLFVLDILKNKRQALVVDFLNENPDIYLPCFKYEDDDQLMNLAIDKYFISWLNDHWNTLEEYLENSDLDHIEQTELRNELARMLLKLTEKWGFRNYTNKGSDLFLRLLKQKQEYLKALIRVDDISSHKLNKLKYKIERDRKLFDRQITKLLEESDNQE